MSSYNKNKWSRDFTIVPKDGSEVEFKFNLPSPPYKPNLQSTGVYKWEDKYGWRFVSKKENPPLPRIILGRDRVPVEWRLIPW